MTNPRSELMANANEIESTPATRKKELASFLATKRREDIRTRDARRLEQDPITGGTGDVGQGVGLSELSNRLEAGDSESVRDLGMEEGGFDWAAFLADEDWSPLEGEAGHTTGGCLDPCTDDPYFDWLDDSPNLTTNLTPPVDLLNSDELEYLKISVRMQHLSGIEALPKLENHWEQQWASILAEALCQDEGIQYLLVDKQLSPGDRGLGGFKLNPLWVLGVPLPGSYEVVDSISDIMVYVDNLTPTILEAVEKMLDEAIEATISRLDARWRDFDFKSIVSTAPPTEDTVKLMQIVRAELESHKDNIHSRDTLKTIENMPHMSSLSNLAQFLDSELGMRDGLSTNPASKTLDAFTGQSLGYLRKWEKDWMVLTELPTLTATDISTIDNPHYYHNHGVTTDQRDHLKYLRKDFTDDEAVDDQQDHSKTILTSTPLYQQLHRRIREHLTRPQYYRQWRAPITGALDGFPPSRAGDLAWNPFSLTSTDHVKHDCCGSSSREPIVESVHIRNKVLNGLKHNFCSVSLPEITMFERVCREMLAVCSRPTVIAKLPPGFTPDLVPLESSEILDDWWHCRRLLQMVQNQTTVSDEAYRRFEGDLLMVLAAIRSIHDPIPWLLTLDGLLDRMHIVYMSSCSGKPLQRKLLGELALFAHGTSKVSMESRLPKAPLLSFDTVRWYSMIHHLFPNCANKTCARSLPSPRAIFDLIAKFGSQRNARMEDFAADCFSVSTRESRVGHPVLRSFISTNRNYGYCCLQRWMRVTKLHPALAATFFWYSTIHHKEGCKPAWGK